MDIGVELRQVLVLGPGLGNVANVQLVLRLRRSHPHLRRGELHYVCMGRMRYQFQGVLLVTLCSLLSPSWRIRVTKRKHSGCERAIQSLGPRSLRSKTTWGWRVK